MITFDPNWPELSKLAPGSHVIILGADYFTAFYARAAGLEVRDTLAHVFPGGAETIIVCRKPLTSTVAETVLEHGSGALHIDACRVQSSTPVQANAGGFGSGEVFGVCSPDAEYQLGTGRTYRAGGRWPTNLVFTHSPECKRIGTRGVKNAPGGHAHTSAAPISMLEKGPFREKQNRPRFSYGDDDGIETIDVWSCTTGCPVKALDELSGELRTNAGTYRGGSEPDPKGWGTIRERPEGTVTSAGSTGGASRFFPQFESRNALLDWLRALIGDPPV